MSVTRWIAVLVFFLVVSGCMKTRSQIRAEEDAPENAHPVQVQPVSAAAGGNQYAIEELKAEILRLNGRIDEMRGGDEVTKKLEARMAELEKKQTAIIETLNAIQERLPPEDPAQLLEDAKTQMIRRDYTTAIDNLTKYLNNPKAEEVEEATYMRAESHFAMRNFRKAIVDYSKFQDTYTKSKFAPKALYKIGLAFESIGTPEDAKAFFQLLIEKYPKSAEAKQARSKLR